jgi:UDP-N-acetylglucosamine--N-acetylmuramyl-(pentapeptide) pyrophosphoryl-undecaprenol N-acetylglucosamine transferase
VPAQQLVRTGVAGKVAALARVGPCITRGRRILDKRRTRLVIGSGGYASGGVLLAARSLGLSTAIIEPNVQPGLANRLLKRTAQRAYFTHPGAARGFPPDRILLTGTPVRCALARGSSATRRPPAPGEPRRVLVLSGSRGAEFLSRHVPPLLGRLRGSAIDIEVLHQLGAPDDGRTQQAYDKAGVTASVVSHIADMPRAYGWAHLAIARAGASTLAELALAGLPSLIVPLADAAEGHQTANARCHAETGAAAWISESEWEPGRAAEQLAAILLDADKWQAMARSARALAIPDAAAQIVDDCERVMRDRW